MGQSQASKNVQQRDIRAGLVERIRAGQYNYHVLGKAQFEKCWVYLGIAQIAIAPPLRFVKNLTNNETPIWK